MGLFGDFLGEVFNSAMDMGVDATRKKYEEMPVDQLRREWQSVFGGRGIPSSGLGYDDRSPNAVLDEVYGRRVDFHNWRYKVEQHQRQQAEKQREQENQRRARDAQKAAQAAERDKRKKRNADFSASLASNQMVQEILSRIDELAFKAGSIYVREDCVECYGCDEDETENDDPIAIFRYRRYGYPKLERWQSSLLARYICEHLKLKYELHDDYKLNAPDDTKHSYDAYLELNDAPGGMRDSW